MITWRFNIFFFIFFFSGFASAQKGELKELCIGLQTILTQSNSLHLCYTISIKSTEEEVGESEVMMNLYKNSAGQHLVIGNFQEVIQQGNVMIIVDHVQRTLVIQEDFESTISENTLLDNLEQLVTTASSIELVEQKGNLTYIVNFNEENIYKLIELVFSGKSKRLLSLLVKFSSNYQEPFEYIRVDYLKWDLKWKPEKGFPNIERYILKAGKHYQAQSTWREYKFHQGESN